VRGFHRLSSSRSLSRLLFYCATLSIPCMLSLSLNSALPERSTATLPCTAKLTNYNYSALPQLQLLLA
jgi:hypothetical protein